MLFRPIGIVTFRVIDILLATNGRYIGLTGARLDAADLLNLGLGDYFIPSYEIPFLEDKLTSVYMDSKLSVGQVLQSFAHEPKKLESKVVSLQHEVLKHTMGFI